MMRVSPSSKMIKIALVGILVLILMLSILYLPSIGFSSERGNEIRVGLGVEFNTHATPIWVAIHSDLPNKYGIKIDSLLKFRTGADLASALARGDVDLGIACLGPVINLVDRNVDVKIVGKVHNNGYALIVNPERITSPADLNGFTVYSTGIPNPTNILLLRVRDFYGVEFNIKPIGDPNMILSMLISGQIDAAALPEHYSSVAEENGLKVLLREKDVWPRMPGSYVIARGELVKNNPELVKNFLEMINEGIRIIEVNKTIASHACSLELGIDDKTALKSLEHIEWDTEINITEIQEYADFMFTHGLIENRINASEIVVKLK